MAVPRSYPELLAALFWLSPPVVVFGGFAQDALVTGATSREHGDVDVIVWRAELAARLEQFRALGFSGFETYYEPRPGQPLVVGGASTAGLNLEPTILDGDQDRPWAYLLSGDRLVRVTLSGGLDKHPPVILDGVKFKSISPLGLYQVRAALDLTQAFGPVRPQDIVAQQGLRERYFRDVPESGLNPTLTLAE